MGKEGVWILKVFEGWHEKNWLLLHSQVTVGRVGEVTTLGLLDINV